MNDEGHVLETQGSISGRFTGSRVSDGTRDLDEGIGGGLVKFDGGGGGGVFW